MVLGLLGYKYPLALLFVLPECFSSLFIYGLKRIREREADYIGLLLMAEAGLNSAGAFSLWTKYNEWEDEQWRTRPRVWYSRKPRFVSKHPYVSFHYHFLFT